MGCDIIMIQWDVNGMLMGYNFEPMEFGQIFLNIALM